MPKLLMVMLALCLGLSVAACSGGGFATPVPSGWSGGAYNPMAGGGG